MTGKIKRFRKPAGPVGPTKYFHGVADARFVIRKVFRIVDERAKTRGLDPLEHQALIQVFGARDDLSVGDVAERLDISATFSSKLMKTLIHKGLVSSMGSPTDQRVTHLKATPKGAQLLVDIDRDVREHVDFFTRHLRTNQKAAALSIFAFYVGMTIDIRDPDE